MSTRCLTVTADTGRRCEQAWGHPGPCTVSVSADPPSPAIGVPCGFDEVVRALKAGYGARRSTWGVRFVLTQAGKLIYCFGNNWAPFVCVDEHILAEDWTICGPNGEP
jgi:hypothetical protein